MVAIEGTLGNLAELLAPMWVETLFMVFFVVGFAIVHRSQGNEKTKKGSSERKSPLHKRIEADAEAGQCKAALKTWNEAKFVLPTPVETLKAVVQVSLELQPNLLVEDITEHFNAHSGSLKNAKASNAVLDVVARAGKVQLMDELAVVFKTKMRICPTLQTFEVLLGGHASVGDERRVSALLSEMQDRHQKLTARGYSLMIKGFLKHGMVDAALKQMKEMHTRGFFVPSFAVAQLFRTACQHQRCEEMFDAVRGTLKIPQDAVVVLLEDCCRRNDIDLALRVEEIARESKEPFPIGAYDVLLKLTVAHANVYALELFAKMQKDGLRISEGLCVGLLARCADSKFLRFADEVVSFMRSRHGMTISSYSALMKVYAYCGLYDKACDLYSQICAEGLEPDSMMYGCLMKFAVECGRTDLSRELFAKSPQLDIQNYMSLIRAAGRDKDIARAFKVLEKLKESCVTVDIAAYNCVLDACVSAGEMARARSLMSEMQKITTLDIITFNTLLKGYCAKGDVRGAKDVFHEMDRAGLAPNDVSYNCLINAAVSSGNFHEAWNTVDMMEKNKVSVDHYTISIMMKSLKKVNQQKDVVRALELLDRSGVDVCSDEVLLNTVLETCTKHKQFRRLEGIVTQFTNSNLRPSVHTYGSLIKACSALQKLDKCINLWDMMVRKCALDPNDIVLGCMLDAHVCNGRPEDAVTLLNQWKHKVVPNTVMYSTIIKGFANSRQASRALHMYKEMCDLGLTFNTVVYNALVDSQARVGAMDEVFKLVESMQPHGVSPDRITYSTIVKGYCVKGDVEKAFDVFRGMQRDKLASDSIVYNTIMDGCTRHNRMDLVDLVLEDMEKNNIKPSNFTLGILVKMYGRRHQLDKAFNALEELPRKHGLQVNLQVKTCLMCACLSNHDLDRSTRVFEDIKAEFGADSKLYSSFISGLIRMGQLEKSVAMVQEAYGLGPTAKRGLPYGQMLEENCLEQLVRALGQKQHMQGVAGNLLESLRMARVPVSGKLFSIELQSGRSK